MLREGKGMTWEGGMRVPAIAWWPGKIPPGQTSSALASTMDILPTSIKMAGGKVPADRIIDGYDLTETLKGNSVSPREVMYFYRGVRLMAIRKGPWKAHFTTQGSYVGDTNPKTHDPPLLYHLGVDPSEKWDVGKEHPDIVAELIQAAEEHKKTVQPVESQLEIPLAASR